MTVNEAIQSPYITGYDDNEEEVVEWFDNFKKEKKIEIIENNFINSKIHQNTKIINFMFELTQILGTNLECVHYANLLFNEIYKNKKNIQISQIISIFKIVARIEKSNDEIKQDHLMEIRK